MEKFKLKIKAEYEVEAENEDKAYIELEEHLAKNNMTAENEFWDNLEVKRVKYISKVN